MKLVEFYRGEIPNNEGVWLKDIMNYTHSQLETDHAWIQWVFPTREPSDYNVEAPLITADEVILFQNDPKLKQAVWAAALKVLDFWGMEYCWENAGLLGENVKWKNGTPFWITAFNHNFLRMTRFLASLRFLGQETLSRQVFECLMMVRDLFKDTTYKFWHKATHGSLFQKYKAFIYLEERKDGGFFVRFTVDRPKNMGWYTSGPLKNGRIYKEAKDAEQMVKGYVLHSMKQNDVEYIGVVDRKTLQEKIKCYSDRQDGLLTGAITP